VNNEKGAFRPIYSSIWDDAEFQSFDDTEKLVFFHLRTSRFGNFPCIFVCYPEVIARHLRKQARVIGRALEGLSKALWIALDGEVVWIVKGLRNDPIFTSQNVNQMKGIASALKSLPKRQVVKNFCDFYRIPEEYRPSWTAFDGPAKGPSKGLPYPCLRALEDTETLNRKPETGELNKNILSGKPDDIRTEEIPFSEILSHLNAKAGKSFKATRKDTQSHIRARWQEGYRLEDFKKVVDDRVARWKGDPKWAEYLRPSTLFGPKFEAYLNAGEADGRRSEKDNGAGSGTVHKPGKYTHLGIRINVDSPPAQDPGNAAQGGSSEEVPAGPKE